MGWEESVYIEYICIYVCIYIYICIWQRPIKYVQGNWSKGALGHVRASHLGQHASF